MAYVLTLAIRTWFCICLFRKNASKKNISKQVFNMDYLTRLAHSRLPLFVPGSSVRCSDIYVWMGWGYWVCVGGWGFGVAYLKEWSLRITVNARLMLRHCLQCKGTLLGGVDVYWLAILASFCPECYDGGRRGVADLVLCARGLHQLACDTKPTKPTIFTWNGCLGWRDFGFQCPVLIVVLVTMGFMAGSRVTGGKQV